MPGASPRGREGGGRYHADMRTAFRNLIGAAVGLVLIAPLVSCVGTSPTDAPEDLTSPTRPSAVADAGSRGPVATGGALPLLDRLGCTAPMRFGASKVDGGEWQWAITGSHVDAGAKEHATGTANDDLTEYVVAPGDTFTGIGERFCIDNIHLAMINRRDSGELYAGETIRLFPDGAAADYFADVPE